MKLSWQEPVSGKAQSQVWNLFQQWCSKNDTVPQGKVNVEDRHMLIKVILKRRVAENDNHPLDEG